MCGLLFFVFSSRRRHTRCALVTGVQTCALPIFCKAMLETGLLPDFIVVDGGEGGTGAAPLEFADHIGTPLQEALLLVHTTLVGLDLRKKIRIGASGKIISAFDMARTLAFGADWCNAARGFMFALGCVQSRSCHTDRCPTGVATQDKARHRENGRAHV